MDLQKLRKWSAFAYIVYIICFYEIIFFKIEPFHSIPDIFGLLGNLMCFPLFYIGIKNHNKESKKPWQWFVLAAILYFAGEAVWAYYSNVLGKEPQNLSICDMFYFLASCICFVGLISYMKQMRNINIMSLSFDMIISIIAATGIIYNFIIVPIIAEKTASWQHLFFVLYNPVMDITFLACLMIILFSTENKKFFTPVNILISLAFLLMFELDQFSLIANIYNLQFNFVINPLWSTTYLMVAIASTYQDNDYSVEVKASWKNVLLEYLRILLPYVLTFMILFLIGHEYKILNSLFLWSIALIILLSLRQIFVLVGNKHLVKMIQENEKQLNKQNLELQKLNQKILHDAENDFLTQLFNRRYIDKTFEKLIPAYNEVESIGLMLIDVDYFKRINDTFGHQIGDQVLQGVATAIRSVIRFNDIAGRFGGDEFIILLPGANIIVTEMIAKNLTDYIHENADLKKYGVTLSIGCTSCEVTRQNYEADFILKQADDALYKAKENGRNQYVVFSELLNA